MEYQGRRNRRGRDRRIRQYNAPHNFAVPTSSKSWSFWDGLSSFFIMGSLIAITYLMLDYHCTVCSSRCDLTNITRNIDDIAVNISSLKESYYDLETKVRTFSHELPKIEGQIEILESLAHTVGGGGDYHQSSAENDFGTKVDDTLPNNNWNYESKPRNVTKEYKKSSKLHED